MSDTSSDSDVKIRRGGRPSRLDAEKIRDSILDCATRLFFTAGYGPTSIETLASYAGISKRTFYARFEDKADLFRAVVHRIVKQLKPANTASLFAGKSCEENLQRVAHALVHAAVSPQAVALHRLLIAEAPRFPELTLAAHQQGARQEAVTHIAAMLKSEMRAGRMHQDDAEFCAEQFLQLVMAYPLRRALGFGKAMTAQERDHWALKSVKLFMDGCRSRPT